MSRWLLALFLAAAAPDALAREAVAAIDSCISRLDPGLDVGYARIAERCPDLTPSLAATPQAALLPRDWNKPDNELSAGGLAELRTLLTRKPPVPSVRAPRVGRVAALLAALSLKDHARESWWARFKGWLRRIFTPQPAEPDDSWLRRWFRNLAPSQPLLDAIAWIGLAAVIALAGAILVNELRVAGWLGGRQRRAAPRWGDNTAARAPLTLQQLQQASSAEQPHLLLQLIVQRLHEQERLPPSRALTVHELERAARLAGEADRERLAVLTATCEQVRFAAREVAPQSLGAALARGRELLAALEAPLDTAAGAS